MAGRAQLPAHLHQLCVTNVITVLDKEFVLFDKEEIVQLFLEYGVGIRPEDAAWLKETLINSAAHLAVPFPPCKLANFLTYLQ